MVYPQVAQEIRAIMKDNFSSNAAQYAQFRPRYPLELFDFILKKTIGREVAWDCATGSGQVAAGLAEHFGYIEASDISLPQIQQAYQASNIHYTLQPAEETVFPNDHFDLLTVGQAVHWFEFDSFYKEARRTLKPAGTIAIIGYGLLRGNKETNRVIDYFYRNIIGDYWDPERRYLDEAYATIPFPFDETKTPVFQSRFKWSFSRLEGYLKTWSAVKHYRKRNGDDPVDEIRGKLKKAFGEVGEITFPILLRVGRNM